MAFISTGTGRAVGRAAGRTRFPTIGTGVGLVPVISFVLLLIIVVVALAAPVVAPYDPLEVDPLNRLQGPSPEHLLGTDAVGRDVLSRLIWGARPPLAGVAIALLGTIALGIPWGLLAGYVGGVVDEVLMRVADALISLPGLILTIAIVGALGPGLTNAMIALSILFSPVIARLMRSSLLSLRQSEFVLVSRSLGTGSLVTAVRHVLPNAMAPVLVQLCAYASLTLLIEAGLSFLGLGVQLPAPDWGADLSDAYRFFTSYPVATVAPGLAVMICAFCVSQVGDGLRTILRTN